MRASKNQIRVQDICLCERQRMGIVLKKTEGKDGRLIYSGKSFTGRPWQSYSPKRLGKATKAMLIALGI